MKTKANTAQQKTGKNKKSTARKKVMQLPELTNNDVKNFFNLDFKKMERARDFSRIIYLTRFELEKLLNLRWSDWNKQERSIIDKKYNSSRTCREDIYLNLTPELEKLIRKQANINKSSDAYIFPVADHTLTEAENLNRIKNFIAEQDLYLKMIAKIINVGRITIEDMLSLAYDRYISDSMSPAIIMDHLNHRTRGHKGIESTINYIRSRNNKKISNH